MYFPNTNRSLSILFLVMVLIGCGGLIVLSAPAPKAEQPAAGGPVRLRLKVDLTTFRKDQATKMWVEFLDGDYNKVANDGTRDVKFEVEPRGSGSFSPSPTVTVKPGEWSSAPPYTTFSPGREGRVLIRVSSAGLDSDQTFLLVTKPAASFLSQILGMFEPVAYADNPIKVLPTSANGTFSTSVGSRVEFQLDFGSAKAGTKIRIFTNPPAMIIDEENQADDPKKEHAGEMYLTLGKNGGYSKPLSVTSGKEGEVKVLAEVLDNGPQASAIATFTPRRPRFIRFSDDSKNITADDTAFPVSVHLADGNGKFIESDRTRKITFSTANGEGVVNFRPDHLELKPNEGPKSVMVLLNKRLAGKELKLLAECPEDRSLEPRPTSVFIHSPLQSLRLQPERREVKRGSTDSEFTISLLNEDGKPSFADENRTINLTVTDGSLSQPQVTILKNQDSAKVQYFPSLATGKVVLRAESVGLREAETEIVLITPLSWLLLAALGGGLIGGVARHLPKGDGLGKYVPIFKRGSQSLAVNILGSLIAGFIFYVAIKLGFSRALGFVLPASLDVGTGLAACFLASVGGYMGVGRVFDGIAGLWERLSAKNGSTAPPIGPSVKNPAQT